jgi:hypothetical protein
MHFSGPENYFVREQRTLRDRKIALSAVNAFFRAGKLLCSRTKDFAGPEKCFVREQRTFPCRKDALFAADEP